MLLLTLRQAGLEALIFLPQPPSWDFSIHYSTQFSLSFNCPLKDLLPVCFAFEPYSHYHTPRPLLSFLSYVCPFSVNLKLGEILQYIILCLTSFHLACFWSSSMLLDSSVICPFSPTSSSSSSWIKFSPEFAQTNQEVHEKFYLSPIRLLIIAFQ